MAVNIVGAGAKYLAAARDAIGNHLSGGNACKLNLAKRIPVDLFWSVTVYDALTASGLDNGQPSPRSTVWTNQQQTRMARLTSTSVRLLRASERTGYEQSPTKTISWPYASTAQLRPSSIKLGEQTTYRKYNDSQPLTGRTEVSKRHLWDQAAMSAFGTKRSSQCFHRKSAMRGRTDLALLRSEGRV
jgi:hypothetical protein